MRVVTQAELDAAAARMKEERRRLQVAYETVRREDRFPNGWDSPPAVMPRAGETALGFGYDPDWNTR